MRRTTATIAGLALSLLAAPLSAQDSVQVIVRDTVQMTVQEPAPASPPRSATPEFRRGQWAGLFRMGTVAYGVGAMRFSSPDKAWTYLGSVSFFRENATSETNSLGLALQVGRRTYAAPRGRVRAFRQLGGQVGLERTMVQSAGSESSLTELSVGAHGMLGATIFVLRELSVGADWTVTGGYFRRYVDSPFGPDDPTDGWTITAGQIQVSGAFYF
jgi:hypothetical protein